MKLRRSVIKIVMLLNIILLYGCVFQEIADCELEDNCELRFMLNSGSNMLSSNMHSIDLFLFDQDGEFFNLESVVASKFTDGMSMMLTLPPGEYRVVAWANICDKTSYTNEYGLMTAYLETISGETGSELYYAPSREDNIKKASAAADSGDEHIIVVKPGEHVEKDMVFTRAHRNINVYIDGIDDMPGYDEDGVLPTVFIEKLPYKCDFFMHTMPDRKDFERKVAMTNVPGGDEKLAATISVPLSELDDDMLMTVKNGSGTATIKPPLNIRKYVEQNGLNDEEDIDILVLYDNSNADVTITVPEWGTVEIRPK